MDISTAGSIYANNAAAMFTAQDGIGSGIRDEFLKQMETLLSEAEAKGSSGDDEAENSSDIIEQLADPGSAFYQDMYMRMKLQLEMSEEEKKEQAIIAALDGILEGMRSDDRPNKQTDLVLSMANLSKEISQLDRDDPRRAQLDLFRQRLNRLGIYMDLGEGIFGGTKKDQLTLTQQLIREKTGGFDPSAFDLY